MEKTQENALLIDPDKCTGCKICEIACSFLYESVFSPNSSRIHILTLEQKGLDVPVVDQQCDVPACEEKCHGEPVCVELCPTDAITLTDSDSADLVESRKKLKELTKQVKAAFEGGGRRC